MRAGGSLLTVVVAVLASGCTLLPASRQQAPSAAASPAERRPPVAVAAPPAVRPAADAAATGDTAADPATLWQQVAAGLAWPRPVERPEVQRAVAHWRRHPGEVTRVLAAAEPHLAVVVAALERARMPMELALLPAVESGYRARALSRRGAAGLWQFMPATARRYGLRRSWWYDARLDVQAATDAALAHLAALHQRFAGDWLLALAAYNAGEARVQRALARAHAAGLPADYWHLELPRETRRYVPRLLALAELIADAPANGVTLPEVTPQELPVAVDTGGPIDLDQAAELAGVTRALLERLNPALLRWTTPPQGPHRLWLPPAAAERLRARLATLPPGARIAWDAHRVRSGDSLWRLARAYGIPVAELRRINGLHGSRLRIGQVLKVPRLDPARRARIARVRLPDVPPAVHTVQRGESLWIIARRHGVTVEALRAWNRLSPGTLLRPGQRLRIGATGDDHEA